MGNLRAVIIAEIGIGDQPLQEAFEILDILFQLPISRCLDIINPRRFECFGEDGHIAPDIDHQPTQHPGDNRQKRITGDRVHLTEDLVGPQDFQHGKKCQQNADDNDGSTNEFPDGFQHDGSFLCYLQLLY